METSNSEAIFESLNLPPQLFINEILNSVDDLVDEAFNFFLQEASKLLKTEDADRSAELRKGVTYIQDLMQWTLDQRMQKWEEYCLRFCFRIPEGFSLPKALCHQALLYQPLNESSENHLPDLDALTDIQLEAQSNSLHRKLTLAGKESAELGRELHALERQSMSSYLSAASIDETLQLYKKHDANEMFEEFKTMASQFRAQLGNLKRRRIEETQCDRVDKLHVTHGDVLRMPRSNGLSGAKLEELQEFLDEMRCQNKN